MWDRITLKYRAKTILQYSYWKLLGASAIAYFIYYGINYALSSMLNIVSMAVILSSTSIYNHYSFLAILISLASIAVSIFVYYPLLAGTYLLHMNASQFQNLSINTVFLPFTSRKNFNISKAMFGVFWRVFLWSLLFVIPGIIKAYQYRMVPYIIAENPDMDVRQAIDISIEMTRGELFEIFILDMSFFGWALLSLLIPVFGAVFLMPYTIATDIQLFEALKYKLSLRNPYYPMYTNPTIY